MSSDTPRSSITVLEGDRRPANFVDYDLERETAREEKAFESYGGDDPHDPPKSKDVPPVEEQADVNMVTWDGPDDPTNPQNWSKSYKWFITLICCVMTVNVYVCFYLYYMRIQLTPHFAGHSHPPRQHRRRPTSPRNSAYQQKFRT